MVRLGGIYVSGLPTQNTSTASLMDRRSFSIVHGVFLLTEQQFDLALITISIHLTENTPHPTIRAISLHAVRSAKVAGL